MTIQVLADEVASQIAAGEVIERPASVVKELIENSIDAGATKIVIHIESAGKKLIEIIDDGCGIPADELETAVKRHATSKLRTADDLFHIKTLGFRGEALAAAGSVSRMTITTRTAESETAHRIVVDGGFVTSNKPVGAPFGTTITIEDLFYNVPARLKFLKSDTTERNQIETLISRYALAYPDIRWQLINENKTVLQTTGNGNYREILSAIYGLDIAKQFIEVELDEEGLTIFGFISPVGLTRSNRKEMNYFVNGRWVQEQALNSSVQRAYQTLIMVGRFPIIALFISIDPEDVDVNVHPAKAEVRFKNPDRIIGGVHRAVRRGLITQSPVPELNTPTAWPSYKQTPPPFDPNGQGVPTAQPLWRSNLMNGTEAAAPAADVNMDELLSPPGPAMPQTTSSGPVYQPFMPQPVPVPQESQTEAAPPSFPAANPTPVPPSVTAAAPAAQKSSPFFPILRWIGQVGSTYIIAEGPDGLYLIDQHAAHERILYEKMLDAEANGTIVSQALLEPAVVQLPPWQASALEENLPILKHLGFEIEEFGPNAFRVLAMPTLFEKGSPAAAIAAVVEDIENDSVPMQGLTSEKVASYVCKRMAVKAGQTLSTDEQRALIRDLEQCRSPRTCPHGRPTMIHLSIDLLEKQFGRKGAF
ncbi:MAG: DNA mismatch repair endonuclease MutL [Anaerolineaceae bacterium]|nr:DNA mismatch repair endonuclease MutL [Anaerolineaceae bacterium]